MPIGFVLLKDGVQMQEAELQQELVNKIRQDIGAVACLKQTLIVSRLPKTRSGKILRKLLRQIADNESFVTPSTIDDPESIDEIRTIMHQHGIGSPQQSSALSA